MAEDDKKNGAREETGTAKTAAPGGSSEHAAGDTEKPISYRLVYSDRAVRNISIRITPDGEVEVRSPRGVPESVIADMVGRKRRLILRALAEYARLDEARSYYTLDYGYDAPLLGVDYPIVADGEACAHIDGYGADRSSHLPVAAVSCRAGRFDGAFIIPAGLAPIEVERALAGIYAAVGRQYLPERTRVIASDMGIECPPVTLSGAKKQWGSCTHDRRRGGDRICYSWRLMLASPRAVDSVVVHELCHIGEMSHGERFWRHVKRYMPDYSEAHEELKRLAAMMERRFHV